MSNRPLITFIILGYNQERFIAEAVQGAFNQTYSPLEILLSDDCSTDHTFAIMSKMAKMYQGPHTIILNRNAHNLGFIGHINRLMEMVKGELIVVAAGDDVSLGSRVEEIYNAYIASGKKALSIYSSATRIDEYGNRTGHISATVGGQFDVRQLGARQIAVIGNTHAWHRILFEVFGPLDPRVIQEDAVIPFRAALLGKVIAIEKALVLRRHHTGNLWLHPKGSNFSEMVAWQQARFEQRIDNLIGLYQTKLNDLERLAQWSEESPRLALELRSIVKKSLCEAQMEKHFFHASSRERMSLILNAFRQKVPLRRLTRWIIQYTLPQVYYRLYRLPRVVRLNGTRLQ